MRATITAVGQYVPERVLTNFDLEQMVDTSDEWIRTRTGIRTRHIMEDGATSDMAVGAARQIIEQRNIDPGEIDVIIVATVTPDMMFPPTACLVQEQLQAKNAWGFDLSAACCGFLYAFVTGCQFVESGRFRKVMVIGADKMSSITDYNDRNICVLFGDAAAAVLIEPCEESQGGVLDQVLRVDGSGSPYLYQKAGGSRHPASHETVDNGWHYLAQDGPSVFKVAVRNMAACSAEIMQRNDLTNHDVDWLVPHQANRRIIDACAKRMGLDASKVMVNIDRYGNTTAATIPLCLSEWWSRGELRSGQNIVMSSFGAGFTWGSVLMRWTLPNASD